MATPRRDEAKPGESLTTMGSLSSDFDEAPGSLDHALGGPVAPHDLDQRHDVDRIEEMETHQSLGSRHALPDPADRQRRRIRAENRVRADSAPRTPTAPGASGRGPRGRPRSPARRPRPLRPGLPSRSADRGPRCARRAPPFRARRPGRGWPRSRASAVRPGGRIDVEQARLEAGRGAHMGDAVSHRPGTDHDDRPPRGEGRCRSSPGPTGIRGIVPLDRPAPDHGDRLESVFLRQPVGGFGHAR